MPAPVRVGGSPPGFLQLQYRHGRLCGVVAPGERNRQVSRTDRHLDCQAEAGGLKDAPCWGKFGFALILWPTAPRQRIAHLRWIAQFSRRVGDRWVRSGIGCRD